MVATFIYFILALFILITIHELGHFWVARLCGVKVLRFSFGFGKILGRWKDKKGTEYAWSLLPIGGYVKMMDEDQEPIAPSQRHLAFHHKSVWARIAIIAAGPLFNFIFAFVALWLVLVLGIHSFAPWVQSVKPNSLAASIGLEGQQEIVTLNKQPIASWRDFQFVLLPLLGSEKEILMETKSLKTNEHKTLTFSLASWKEKNASDLLDALGIVPFRPHIPPVVDEVIANHAAANAGLQKGDVITAINGHELKDWLFLVDYVKKHPDKIITLTFVRAEKRQQVKILIGSKAIQDKKEGFIGMRPKAVDWPAKWIRFERQGPFQAIKTAFAQTLELTEVTFLLIKGVVIGQVGKESIGGPISIAQGAGQSARGGLVYYLSFLALVSISLGVLNLLPIPMLDGGHLFYCLIEIVRGKPLSQGVKTAASYLGLMVLLLLMGVALLNDFTRLF